MEYKIFKFHFSAGVHIGDGSLDDFGYRLRADTLFSALCAEALKASGEGMVGKLADYAKNGLLKLSDAFPFIEDKLYMIKPAIGIKSERDDKDSAAKKTFKRLKYIPFDKMDSYLSGNLDAACAKALTKEFDENLGKAFIHAHAAVRLPKDTKPYHVGTFTFNKGAGLFIIACGNSEILTLLRGLLNGLSYAGIGGKRSGGLGRFTLSDMPIPKDILPHLTGEYSAYMTLSISLPNDEELEDVLKGASYALIRRSGFAFSESFAPVRKNDFYALDSGAVVGRRYKGGVYDVANKLPHPVYRYATPLFLGVKS